MGVACHVVASHRKWIPQGPWFETRTSATIRRFQYQSTQTFKYTLHTYLHYSLTHTHNTHQCVRVYIGICTRMSILIHTCMHAHILKLAEHRYKRSQVHLVQGW